MKQSYTLTFLILATIIGAGFASGKEIYVFFTSFGVVSFINIIIVFFLFYFSIKLYLDMGRINKPQNIIEVNKIILGKYYGIFNIFYLISYLIVLAGMFAGVYEVYLNVLNPTWSKILVLVTVLLCIIENNGGIKSINKINNIFMPITLLLLFVSALITLLKNGVGISNLDLSTHNSIFSIISVCCYVGINILLSGGILMQVGNAYNKQSVKKSSIFSSLCLVIIILVFNLVMLKTGNLGQMPMVELAFQINYYWGIVVIIGIWFCIYSAITSLVYVLSSLINIKVKSNFISNLIILVLGYVVSMFGFGQIITYLYPIIGVVGISFTIMLLKNKYYANKQKTMQ